MVEVAANLLVAFLLVLTTTWCVLLYRRLDRLRVERRDIESFVAAIDAATQRAETAIAGLRVAAGEAHQALSGLQEQARSAWPSSPGSSTAAAAWRAGSKRRSTRAPA